MPPVLRAVHKKAEDLLPLGTSSNKATSSTPAKSRIFRLLVVFSTLALLGYLFASAFHNMLLRAHLVPMLQAPPPAITVPKTLLQLQEEAGEREARQMEEEEAEEQEEEEVSPGDGGIVVEGDEEEDERQDIDDTPEAISAASSELDEDDEDSDDIEQQHDLPQEEQDDVSDGTKDIVTATAAAAVEEDAPRHTMLRSHHDDELEIQDSLGPEDRLALERENTEKAEIIKPEFNFTMQMLHQRGMGKVVFVYRVIAAHVVVRTQPSPIGALRETAPKGALMGMVKFTSPHGSILVGSHVSQQFGMWLKLAPHVWAPISKKESADTGFVNQMRLVRKLPIPDSLSSYWKQQPVDCSTAAASKSEVKQCEEENAIRNAVVEFLRRNTLIDGEPTR